MDLRELWQPNPEAIRRLRRERGWSRFQLAAQAGVSPHTITRAERGFALFPSTLRIIGQALNKPAEELCLNARPTDDFDGTTAKRIQTIFRHMAAVDRATRILNADVEHVRSTLEVTSHEDVIVTLAVTGEKTIASNTICGIPALVQHFSDCHALMRREDPFRIADLQPIGTQQILCTAADRMWDFRLDGYVTGFCSCLFTFRGERIAMIQQTMQANTFQGQPLSVATPEQVGVVR